MTERRVCFRTDASVGIGHGHVMRCLALAAELRRAGIHSHFICASHPGHLANRITAEGHGLSLLPEGTRQLAQEAGQPIHANWLARPWQEDAEMTIAAIRPLAPDWLVVDHYGIDHRWEECVRRYCGQLAAVDDLADRRHDCDLLVDQNLGRETSAYAALVPGPAKILTGPAYALLRHEFPELRAQSLARRGQGSARRLLVAMGGTDQGNATSRLLLALSDNRFSPEVSVTIVLGDGAPWAEGVRKLVDQMPFECELRQGVGDMARLMVESDLAIGGAGTSSWERCCLGLPSLVAVLAANQAFIADSLVAAGAARKLPMDPSTSPIEIRRIVEEVATDGSALARMSSSAAALTSGEGCRIVTEFMMGGHHENYHPVQ